MHAGARLSDRPPGDRPPLSALREVGCGALAVGLPLLVYLRTMAPTVYGLDSAELTTGAYALGIVHAPGSPTYMLLGHVFAQLPLGDVGYRLNLMSAVAAALAVLFLYLVLRRLTGEAALALCASWFVAFTYYFWVSALAAELYAVHAAVTAALLVLALRWREAARPRDLYALALLCGLGAGNHLSMVLLLPGFAWLVATGSARPSWRALLSSAAALAVGLAVYLYLPIRFRSDTPLNYARTYWGIDLSTPSGFMWMLSARMFESFIFGVAPRDLPHEIVTYVTRLWSNFVGLGAVLGVVGLYGDARNRPSLHVGLALLFLGHLAFYLPYGVMDKDLMLLPTYLVWTVWAAIGAQVLAGWCARRRLPMSAAALVGLLAVGALAMNFSRLDLSEDWSARQRGEEILATLPPDAVYLGSWLDVPILEYLQIVEGQRRDIRTENLVFRAGGGRIATDVLRAGGSVFTALPDRLADTPGLCTEYVAACDCYRIDRAGRCLVEVPRPQTGGAARASRAGAGSDRE
ncbi:MAG: protein O-mannosyl-transferase family [Candidatus Binatia bacterium]